MFEFVLLRDSINFNPRPLEISFFLIYSSLFHIESIPSIESRKFFVSLGIRYSRNVAKTSFPRSVGGGEARGRGSVISIPTRKRGEEK